MRRLVGPDALLEPIEELQSVGLVAEQRLAEVHVRLHQAGQHCFARAIDHLRARRRPQPLGNAHDAAVLHQQVGSEDPAPGVDREDGPSAQEHGRHRRIV